MAEGVLFEVAKGIIEKAGNLAIQEIGLLRSLKDEIEKLNDTVLTIIKVWLKRLKDAIYDADNLLDDISTEALRREVMTQNKKAKEVRIFFSKSNQLAYGFKMGHKVKAMRERLDTIAKDRARFHLDERRVETQVVGYGMRETYSFVRDEEVIGRENDRKEIIRILLDPNVEGNVSILPIVGLGGLGKTTLAQLVFNDKEIKKHFEQKLWVFFSDNFDVKIIVEKILQSAKSKKPENLEMDPLINNLKKEIDGKRYILVLDNVWNEDREKWFGLKTLLMGGARGSRISVTTRINKVAEITKTIRPYMLEALDEEKSWSIFKKFAFANEQDSQNLDIKKIGMEIIAKCKGVPLAIRTLGSDNELSKVAQKENDILPTLKLSYDHLLSYLKQCFASCCSFPKDSKILKPILIKMWMAQGFITSSSQSQCPEDIGHDYFMELLWRLFFQEVEEDEWGNIINFKVHDLMHDLAKLVVASDSVTFYSKEEDIYEKTLHVSFDRTFVSSSGILVSLYKSRKIRTFHFPSQSQDLYTRLDKSTCNAIVSSFKFICLLNLHEMRIETIPSSIRKLRHLRYLDLSSNSIKMLPNSITRLHNLQTLRLTECHLIKELPKDINKLVNLMYLEIDGCSNLTHTPRGLGQLIKLRTLSQFVISKNTYFAFRRNSGLKELYKLNKLRGTLMIRGLRHEKDAALESKDANMKEKQCLQGLTLRWIKENDVDESNVGYDQESLVALLPHGPLSNLQELCLIRYGEVKFSNEMEWHGLQSLRCLLFIQLPNLATLPVGIQHLTTLQSLRIGHCSRLLVIPEWICILTSLQTLEIWGCPILSKGCEREAGEDWRKIAHIPH
ncbi:hypothetical protein ACB092_11G240600 [Castanea dentata]